ncbi:hypothetical protein ACFODZ_06060 [Marinicella sediminis]|uniref:DUF4064 domain-containing protein n=1 Tax=Marinicella sediminis TaxID=1792834 RepID=A0ABV7JA79_9GAMM|nr:hypothetical protein [Marinicella sediminis]
MRVAAGVILIIAAVLNLLASLGYLAGGAATTGVANMAESGYVQGQELTAEQRAELEEIQNEVGGSGIGLMAFGVFLLVSVGILIAGAVFLFQDKKPQFIMVAGAMAILAEVIGILITNFGVTNILGLVGGVLAIIAAKSMGGAPAPAE